MLKNKENLSDLLGKVCSFLDGLNKAIEINNCETSLTKRIKFLQHRSAGIRNSSENDRIIPLEAVTKSEFELKKDTELGNTKIIYGHGADEMLRSNGLIAFALANKIYIQTHKYKPETEEGRALLAHELTHVQQYSEKRVNNRNPKDELEKEAELSEKAVYYNSDTLEELRIGSRKIKIRNSQKKQLMQKIENEYLDWLERQERKLNSQEYLELLIAVKERIDSGEMLWQQNYCPR